MRHLVEWQPLLSAVRCPPVHPTYLYLSLVCLQNLVTVGEAEGEAECGGRCVWCAIWSTYLKYSSSMSGKSNTCRQSLGQISTSRPSHLTTPRTRQYLRRYLTTNCIQAVESQRNVRHGDRQSGIDHFSPGGPAVSSPGLRSAPHHSRRRGSASTTAQRRQQAHADTSYLKSPGMGL